MAKADKQKRIKIIPAIHGKVTSEHKISEPDVYWILEKWLERHPEIKKRQKDIRIVRGLLLPAALPLSKLPPETHPAGGRDDRPDHLCPGSTSATRLYDSQAAANLLPPRPASSRQIDQQTAEQMRRWPNSGFSVDHSVYLAPHNTSGLRRLAEYILRCPVSLARVVRRTEDGLVIYRVEKDHCHRFPGPASADLRGGPKRNFQVFSALDFLAEVTQHIPDKGEHLVRYYGWYSHRQRGIREKGRKAGQAESDKPTIDRSALEAPQLTAGGASSGGISTWAMLSKRVYEVDPLQCPCCGGQMKIVSFIERCQGDVIEQILRHCGLWEGPLRTSVGPRPPPQSPDRASAQHDLDFAADPEYQRSERIESDGRESPAEATRELQLVLDPEFL